MEFYSTWHLRTKLHLQEIVFYFQKNHVFERKLIYVVNEGILIKAWSIQFLYKIVIMQDHNHIDQRMWLNLKLKRWLLLFPVIK